MATNGMFSILKVVAKFRGCAALCRPCPFAGGSG